MSDDLDPPSADEQRAALRHIMHYRRLRREIRASGTGTLFWGGLLLVVWYLGFYQTGRAWSVLGLVHLGLAAAEFGTGLVKKLLAVPEAFLLEAGVFLGFAAANGYRAVEARRQGAPLPAVTVVFAVWMAAVAVGRVRAYRALARSRFRRPSAEQLRWYDDLVAETRAADPEGDPASLDLPTDPPLRVKLLGDLALTLEPGQQEPDIVDRPAVRLDRFQGHDGRPVGELLVHGSSYGRFPLDEYNWSNYAAWKAAGGDPPPAEVRRLAGE